MTREEFIKYIDDRLSGTFTKEEEKWSIDKTEQGPQQVIIINGRRSVQPGPEMKIESLVEVAGDGDIKDVNSETGEPFLQIHFKSVINGQTQIDVEECLYYDDVEIFDNIINQIFGI